MDDTINDFANDIQKQVNAYRSHKERLEQLLKEDKGKLPFDVSISILRIKKEMIKCEMNAMKATWSMNEYIKNQLK